MPNEKPMKKEDVLIIKQAVVILKKEFKDCRCKTYQVGCMQCSFDRLVDDLDTFYTFYLKELLKDTK